MESLFGDVIYSYTRKQAIADGVLIDLSANYPDETAIYKYPVACTAAVWEIIDRACKNKRILNNYKGVVWDVLYMSQQYIISKPTLSIAVFCVNIIGAGRKKLYRMKAVVGPGDKTEPVVTIMLLEED